MTHVVPMCTEHIPPCAHIIGLIPLFEDYRLTPERALLFFEDALSDPINTILCALSDEGVVLGFAWFVQKGAFARSGYLRLLAIHPKAHGKGTGRALMEALEQSFLAPAGMFLLTSAHNTKAQGFYKRLGYKQVGTIEDYVSPGLHEYIFFKPASETEL